MSKQAMVTLHYEVRTGVANTYEIDPDHYKQITGTELRNATASELEDYVLENRINTADYNYVDVEILHDDWTLED